MTAAIAQADRGGLASLTMRSLAADLSAAPMALYRHVANKEQLVDAMVDVVFSEIDLPRDGVDWKTAMRQRALSAREVLLRHPWAIGLMESRLSPGPANLRHHDAVLGCLRRAGLSTDLTGHAYALLDSYIYGFALEQTSLPFTSEDVGEKAGAMVAQLPADAYPNLAAFAMERVMKPGYDFADEFEYGLDLILGSLDDARRAARPRTRLGGRIKESLVSKEAAGAPQQVRESSATV